MPRLAWFGVRCVFRHRQLPPRRYRTGAVYEERILVFRARSADAAVAKAEKEASQYAVDGTEYLGFAETFWLFDEDIKDKTEVFSLMRTSKLSPKKYLHTYYQTGGEHRKPLGSASKRIVRSNNKLQRTRAAASERADG
ncbi:MAG: hypothetical protein R3E65_01020 [Steroidobacteraceae bacterium]